MNIIKEGYPEFKDRTRQFECTTCRCVFTANKDEYTTYPQSRMVTATCPWCGERAGILKEFKPENKEV